MHFAGWGRKTAWYALLIVVGMGANCPFFPTFDPNLAGGGPGGNVILRLENLSGLPVVVTARYTIDDNQVRDTVRRLAPEGNDSIAEVLPTRTRLLFISAVVGENVAPSGNSLVQPGSVLKEGEFVWQEDFRDGDLLVFVIPPLDVPGPGTIDCNTNGILDAVDIAEGTSRDCDLNGVPDECDPPPVLHSPVPADDAEDVDPDTTLIWNTPPASSVQRALPVESTVEHLNLGDVRGGSTALSEFFSATGRLFLSIDGGGSDLASHVIEVQKPSASATVRKAFVLAVSTGFSGHAINDGDVQITPPGTGVVWMESLPSSIGSFNYLADVTGELAPTIDAAAPGRIAFHFSEINAPDIDGEALVVVFDDPAQPADRTVILLFGAQDINGDSFGITLAEPIDPVALNATAIMSLGISFGFQPTGQVSLVDVNEQRLTSSAGGQDDGPAGCTGGNGALITVGGLDDSIDNPLNPVGGATSCRTDDEYYSLLPFITNVDTQITVDTLNPSDDDNIFFGAFILSGAAVLGEGIVLGPTESENSAGTQHTVVATVTNENQQPVVGREVTFEVLTGPNQGVTGVVVTDSTGKATFSYFGLGGPGVDQIQASFEDSQEQVRVSNIVRKVWTDPCLTRYDVLFGTSSPPTTILCDDTVDTICMPPQLAPDTTYYWQVIADDGVHVEQGPIWTFTTTSDQ